MKITLEMLKDYEVIRRSGLANMFDYQNVIRVAKITKIDVIAKMSPEEYKELVMNYGKKLKEFNVKQKDLI